MRIMACHLALNRKGALTGARSAVSKPDENWRCPSCDSPLILHPGSSDTHPWFEHNQRLANDYALMYCQYRDHRDGLPGESRRMMLYTIHEQEIRIMAEAWYCVWCGCHYAGEKHCTACNTGIYSIEETVWRENYTCPVNNSDHQPSEDPGLSASTLGAC